MHEPKNVPLIKRMCFIRRVVGQARAWWQTHGTSLSLSPTSLSSLSSAHASSSYSTPPRNPTKCTGKLMQGYSSLCGCTSWSRVVPSQPSDHLYPCWGTSLSTPVASPSSFLSSSCRTQPVFGYSSGVMWTRQKRKKMTRRIGICSTIRCSQRYRYAVGCHWLSYRYLKNCCR